MNESLTFLVRKTCILFLRRLLNVSSVVCSILGSSLHRESHLAGFDNSSFVSLLLHIVQPTTGMQVLTQESVPFHEQLDLHLSGP